jgi:hypothetical protein
MLPFVIKDEDVKQSMCIEQFFPIPVGIIPIDKALNEKIVEYIKSKQFSF